MGSDFFPVNRQKACCVYSFYLLTPKNSTSKTTYKHNTHTYTLSKKTDLTAERLKLFV